jgi:16S rRNA (guanine966-N2)-methyltransferase
MRIGAGRWKNALLPAAGKDVRPVPGRLRTSLFSVLGGRVEGATVLDLCAGVGALGLEALSRGADRAVFVDADPAAVRALRTWIERRGAEGVATAVVADARRGVWPPGPYDLVFLDPPFGVWRGGGGAARPFLQRAIEGLWATGRVVVKLPTDAAIPGGPWRVVDRRSQGEVAYALLEPGGEITVCEPLLALDPAPPPTPG